MNGYQTQITGDKNEQQIDELKNTQKVQTSLILPDDQMWIYGDVYEYLFWHALTSAYRYKRTIDL